MGAARICMRTRYASVCDMPLSVSCAQEHSDVKSQQWGTVVIKKCRYLESSGCVGACVNLCKVRLRLPWGTCCLAIRGAPCARMHARNQGLAAC